MERQAAYNLLKSFLEKRNALDKDTARDLKDLLCYGATKGFFTRPAEVFEVGCWRDLGDKLHEENLDDVKEAKKLGKAWKVVITALKQHQAEQKIAEEAARRLCGNKKEGLDTNQTSYPSPPVITSFILPTASGGVEGVIPRSAAPTISPVSSEADAAFQSSAASAPALALSTAAPAVSTPVFWPLPPQPQLPPPLTTRWEEIARQAAKEGLMDLAQEITSVFPVEYVQEGNHLRASIQVLDWKLLSQLRATVSESGLHGEPARQMLNYMWSGQILLPTDVRNIMKLILTQHQQLLFNAHWQALCQEAVALQRDPADRLHGVTMEELMGLGVYARIEAQATLGPDKLREGMRLARQALERVKTPGGSPSYMTIRQGRDETLGQFVDRVAAAIQAAGTPEWMHGALLKQCVLQNGNQTVRNLILALPGNWSVEELLERASQIPVGSQAFIVNAIKEINQGFKEVSQGLKEGLREGLKEQQQILAALASLQVH